LVSVKLTSLFISGVCSRL